MINKVFTLTLLAVILFGNSAPVLALWMPQEETCGMACCAYDQHSTPVMHTDYFQSLVKQSNETRHQPCPLMGTCGPREIPDGLEVESGVPVVTSKVKAYVSGTLLNHDLYQQVKPVTKLHTAILTTHHPFLSSRDLLNTNSVLII